MIHEIRPCFLARIILRAPLIAMVLASLLVASNSSAAETPAESSPHTIAYLGVEFINDKDDTQPTSDEERARLKNLKQIFTSRLEQSGQYTFVPVPPEMQKAITEGQDLGQCAGCEVEYGKELGVERVAFARVQKVSNLILNLTVYMFDVATGKLVFARAVDMRGNMDETWSHAMNYLIREYLLPSGA